MTLVCPVFPAPVLLPRSEDRNSLVASGFAFIRKDKNFNSSNLICIFSLRNILSKPEQANQIFFPWETSVNTNTGNRYGAWVNDGKHGGVLFVDSLISCLFIYIYSSKKKPESPSREHPCTNRLGLQISETLTPRIDAILDLVSRASYLGSHLLYFNSVIGYRMNQTTCFWLMNLPPNVCI